MVFKSGLILLSLTVFMPIVSGEPSIKTVELSPKLIRLDRVLERYPASGTTVQKRLFHEKLNAACMKELDGLSVSLLMDLKNVAMKSDELAELEFGSAHDLKSYYSSVEKPVLSVTYLRRILVKSNREVALNLKKGMPFRLEGTLRFYAPQMKGAAGLRLFTINSKSPYFTVGTWYISDYICRFKDGRVLYSPYKQAVVKKTQPKPVAIQTTAQKSVPPPSASTKPTATAQPTPVGPSPVPKVSSSPQRDDDAMPVRIQPGSPMSNLIRSLPSEALGMLVLIAAVSAFFNTLTKTQRKTKNKTNQSWKPWRQASPEDVGKAGERVVSRAAKINLNSPDYHLIADVTLPCQGGTTQIDFVIVSRFGIFVIEVKNMVGFIFGKEHESHWTQKTRGNQTNNFQNPLRQNYKHIKALAEALCLPESLFHSVIVFVGKGEFMTPMPKNVTQNGEYTRYVKSKTVEVHDQAQVEALVNLIQEKRLPPGAETDRLHLENLRAQGN